MITLQTWLRDTQHELEAAGISTARLDALVLLEDRLGVDRAQLLAHPERELANTHITALTEQVARRVRHEPLAYVRGKTEFYGREFSVDKRVLEPRPETEAMIELLLRLPISNDTTVIDVGTGSGALAITAKLELPAATVIGVDIDPACLAVARRNAELLRAAVAFAQGDLLDAITSSTLGQLITAPAPDGHLVLLCNLPYVPRDYSINQAAAHEPARAIFGGVDGLDLYRKLFTQLSAARLQPEYIFTEALPASHDALTSIAKQHGYHLAQTQDFIQQFVPSP